MINKLISIIHADLETKCWVELYGGVAYPGKQSVAGKDKTFPVTCWVLDQDDCDKPTEALNTIVPDDSKLSVMFWQQKGQIRTSKIPGISSRRNITRGEANIDLIIWLNVDKFTKPGADKCDRVDAVVLDLLKTLTCRQMFKNTSMSSDGIGNVKLEVTGVGDPNTYRQAMSIYSIDNLEALTMWPFYAFTVSCRISFNFNPMVCDMDEISCSNNECRLADVEEEG